MSYPFKKILCPIEFDDESLEALEVAAGIARQNDAVILLFHVVPMIMAPTGLPVYVDIYKNPEELAQFKLRDIAASRLDGIRYQFQTQVGKPAGAIVRTAKREGVDLIVMAPHGRHGFARMMLGSVAEPVLREAPCPVLCVKPKALKGDSVEAS